MNDIMGLDDRPKSGVSCIFYVDELPNDKLKSHKIIRRIVLRPFKTAYQFACEYLSRYSLGVIPTLFLKIEIK
jgi:hypothetical protein